MSWLSPCGEHSLPIEEPVQPAPYVEWPCYDCPNKAALCGGPDLCVLCSLPKHRRGYPASWDGIYHIGE